MRLLVALCLCSTAALADRVGFYPLQLPHGDAQLAARTTAQLHSTDGQELLPVEPNACGPDEEVCLAAAARRDGLNRIVSASVDAAGNGYAVHVRAFAPDQRLMGEWRGEGSDLAETLQRGVCASLGGGCERGVAPAPTQGASVPPEALGMAASSDVRTQVEVGLFAGGLGLLSAAAGVGLYMLAHPTSQGHASGTPTAGTFALALAATGVGAIAASGLVVVLTPQAATLQARF
jgi:hypothetical protein